MDTTRRGFLGLLVGGAAVGPVLLEKGERVLSLAEAKNLYEYQTTAVLEDGTEIPVGPNTMLTQGLDEPSIAEFTGPVGAYKLGQRVTLTIPEYGLLFAGRVVRCTTHIGQPCKYVATTELERVQPVVDIRHQDMDSKELARRVSNEIMKTIKRTPTPRFV